MMKKYVLLICFLGALSLFSNGQVTSDPFIKSCISSAGPSARYLKDFIVKLGSDPSDSGFRYKAELLLRKNTRYRFTMCTAENSGGQLILNLRDNENLLVLSSVNSTTGEIRSKIDFSCKKSGKYLVCYDFSGGKPGSGVGVVSVLK